MNKFADDVPEETDEVGNVEDVNYELKDLDRVTKHNLLRYLVVVTELGVAYVRVVEHSFLSPLEVGGKVILDVLCFEDRETAPESHYFHQDQQFLLPIGELEHPVQRNKW